MKKISLMLTLAIMMVGSAVFAGSIDYLSNQSAKYDMNTARTGSVDGADTAVYNPAGTALLAEGLYIDLSSQTLLKFYKEEAELKAANIKESYEQDKATPVLPNLYAVYNLGMMGAGKLAVFGNAGIVAGGGSLVWNGIAAGVGYDAQVASTMNTNSAAVSAGMLAAGLPATVPNNGFGTTIPTGTDLEVKGSSLYYNFGLGAAYSLLEDLLSLSLGGKYVISQKSSSLHGKLFFMQTAGTDYNYVTGQTAAQDYSTSAGAWEIHAKSVNESDAKGYTIVVGTDIRPIKELTFGVRYETETKLEYEYDQTTINVTNTFNSALWSPVSATTPTSNISAGLNTALSAMLDKDGDKVNYNLPQILSVGAEYLVMPEMTVGVSSNIYFLSQADMAGYEEFFGTGWEAGLGVTYRVIEPLKLSATFMYTDQGAKDSLYTTDANLVTVSANPVLNSIFMGIGGTFTVMPGLDLSLDACWVHYLPKDITTDAGIDVSMEKEVFTFGFGVGYKM